jgi:hypothetical protein
VIWFRIGTPFWQILSQHHIPTDAVRMPTALAPVHGGDRFYGAAADNGLAFAGRAAAANLAEKAPGACAIPAPESPEEYVVGEGDVLQIHIWEDAAVSVSSAVIRPDGNITIPCFRLLRNYAKHKNICVLCGRQYQLKFDDDEVLKGESVEQKM